jgi:hypothetical protein
MQSRFDMYNPIFYKVFTLMNPMSRQEYFIELLAFIEELGNAYEEFSSNRSIIESTNVNKYKALITKKLVSKLIVKEILEELGEEEKRQSCVELLVDANDIQSHKIGRFKNFRFEMIEKVNGEETKISIDVRNFIIVDYDKHDETLSLQAIYETINPLEIKIQFTDKNSEKDYEKYLRIFLEIIKIGKIEKLVCNIDLIKIFGKDIYDQISRD